MYCIILPITTGLQGCALWAPKHFSWGARASKLVAQINKLVSC